MWRTIQSAEVGDFHNSRLCAPPSRGFRNLAEPREGGHLIKSGPLGYSKPEAHPRKISEEKAPGRRQGSSRASKLKLNSWFSSYPEAPW